MSRPIRAVYYSSHFADQYRRLSESDKRAAEVREALFRADAFDPRLKTHKLKGKLQGYWAFSISRDFRVIFRFLDGDEVLFLAVGSHAEVY